MIQTCRNGITPRSWTMRVLVWVLMLNGCSATIPLHVQQALTEDENTSSVTVYYPTPRNFVLRAHAATLSIDGQPFFFIRPGESISFFLTQGMHRVVVAGLSSHFDHQQALDIQVIEGKHSHLVTYPVFEGMTLIPYWFIPLPTVDIRFKLSEVGNDGDQTRTATEPVNPRDRALMDHSFR